MNNIIQTIRHTARAAAVLLIALLAAQTAWAQGPAQNTCNVKFDISSGGTVKYQSDNGGVQQMLEVTNNQTIDCSIPDCRPLTITPETGYVVSSVTYDATDGLSIDLIQDDDFQWYLYIDSYEGSETPTITVHIVFDKGLAGGADEASAVALTSVDDLSRLTGGWYKVESDLTLGHTWNLHGDTRITIATGATLTVSTSDEYGISGSALTVSGEGTLAVSASNRAIYVDNYTQTGCAVTLSGDTGGLTAENNVSISGGSLTTSGASYGIDTDEGAITISGGTVSASGDQCGLYAARAMNITGGTVNASGNVGNGIRGYSVSITGGQVTASSGGIWSNIGDITLGWTSATDFIKASSYAFGPDGGVNIADGQTLYDEDGNEYSGDRVDYDELARKTLRPYDCRLALSDDADNTAAIAAANGKVYNVTLQGRKLWKDGAWNTLCLPFALTAAQIAANADFAGAKLMTLDVTEQNGFETTGGTMYLSFKEATAIEAGVPYLVKWDKAEGYDANPSEYDIVNPVFDGVTISGTAAQTIEAATDGMEKVQMVGTYSPVSVTAGDKSIMFLGTQNTLYYTTKGRDILSCRAYFAVPYIKDNAAAKVSAFTLNFNDEVTGITTTNFTNFANEAGAWYTLDGRKLSSKPTKKGMYINNGKKIVIE